MNAGFTPGPWIRQPSNAERWSQIIRRSDGVWPYDNVAYIQEMHEDECTNKGAHIANARLIAAAPELLEALQGVLRVADRKTDEFDAAHAAIAKAIGVGA